MMKYLGTVRLILGGATIAVAVTSLIISGCGWWSDHKTHADVVAAIAGGAGILAIKLAGLI